MSINKEVTFSVARATFAIGVLGCLITIIVQVSTVATTFGSLRANVEFIKEGLAETNKKVEKWIEKTEEDRRSTERRLQMLERKLAVD